MRSHTGPVGYAATDLVDALADGASRPGTEVEPSFVVEIGGREWVARNISWDESSGPVVEVHLAAAVDGATDGATTTSAGWSSPPAGCAARPWTPTTTCSQSVLETLVVGGA